MRIQRGLGVVSETPCAGFAMVGCSYGRLERPNLMEPNTKITAIRPVQVRKTACARRSVSCES